MNNDAFNRCQERYDNMLPPDNEIPEVPLHVIEAKIKEWVDDPPDWLLEKADEACVEDWKDRKRW
ncbi:MAG: hypothetical protein KGI54_06960 [Pseudomonadota bacterium]|nr:hypothetical protein [Pseudomonadota bacterium]